MARFFACSKIGEYLADYARELEPMAGEARRNSDLRMYLVKTENEMLVRRHGV